MDSFMGSPLRVWRLETSYDDIGRRYHQRPSGDECWHAERLIGNGSFGDVWQERCVSGPSQNAIRAVKHLRKRQSKFLEMSRRELDALVTFSDSDALEYKHHFVQFLGWFDDAEHFYIAMEFLEFGDLQKFITAPFPEPEAASIVAQVGQALQYMHRKSFVHRDIKPLNILVSSPGPNWHVKVADFGIAKNTDGTALGTHYIGSPGYMAPELYGDSSDKYTAAVDVWALGAVAYCLRTGGPPFRTIKHLLDYSRDHRVQFPIRPLGSSSGFCMNFILGTMADPPERRLTIEHVLAHDWISGQLGAPENGENGGSSTSTTAIWNMSPSNAWSNTYDSTGSQRSQPLSPPTPMTEPEHELETEPHPEPEPAPWPLPSSSLPLQEQASGDRLARQIGMLAVADSNQGKDDKTKTIRPEVPGDKDPNMIKAMADLATIYRKQKRYDRAEMIGEEVVNLRREVFGNEHLDTIDALAKLATTYQEQKKYEQSEDIDKEVVTLRRQVLGDKHPDTMKAKDIIAATYREQSKYDEAAKTYEELFFLRREILGREHTDTIKSLENLNAMYRKQERFDKVTEVDFKDSSDQPNLRLALVAADGLFKDFFRYPDPYAVTTMDGKHVHTTSVCKRTDDPYWNEHVDLKVSRDSILSVQVFDEKKLKKKYQGFLGVITFRVGDYIDLIKGGDEMFTLDLKGLNEDSVHQGKLIVHLSTDLSKLISDIQSDSLNFAEEIVNKSAENDANNPPRNFKESQVQTSVSFERREDNAPRSYVDRQPLTENAVLQLHLPPLRPVFGVSLEDVYDRDGTAVPFIVYQCFQAVELFGLDMEGIYRISGRVKTIAHLQSLFDNDSSKVDLSNPENFYHDVNSVASLVKQFFRNLPDPVFTSTRYSQFVEAARIDDDIVRRDSLHALINVLPDAHYATLRAVILHLNKVQEHYTQNHMSAGNLAICFGPTLMTGKSSGNIADAGWQVRVVETILNNTFQIFDDD